MTAVVLIAVIVDRRAITFRTLAVSAMIVLAIAPEALVHPSFRSLGAFSTGERTLFRNHIEFKGYSPVLGLSSRARKPNKNPNNLGFSV
jgi:predicted membrane metal-binding protein